MFQDGIFLKGKTMRKEILTSLLIALLFAAFSAEVRLMASEGYRVPEKKIVDIVDTPNPPQISVNPNGKTALLVEYTTQLNLEDLAEPTAKLAGIRILTRYNIPRRSYFVKKIRVLDLQTREIKDFKLPENSRFGYPTWSPDGKYFLSALYQPGKSQVWLFDPEKLSGKPIGPARINSVLLSPFWWGKDSQTVFIPTYLEKRGLPPEPPAIPEAPEIQQTSGKVSQVRTYQDLLQTNHDERLFEYYATAQIIKINIKNNRVSKIGKPELITSFSTSPDARYHLVKVLEKPFSRTVPHYRFAHRLEIWDAGGKAVKRLVKQPVGDEIPIEGVQTGMRNAFWQRLVPATLCWFEALDGGDPNNKVDFRDVMKAIDAPFQDPEREIVKLPMRYSGLDFFDRENMALVWDYDRDTRWIKARLIDLSKHNIASESRLVFSRNYYDQYKDDGNLIYYARPDGQTVAILEEGDWAYLEGKGATPEGYRPFLHRFNVKTGEKQEIFRSGLEAFESFVEFSDNSHKGIITAREDVENPRNFFLRKIVKGSVSEPTELTNYPAPAPELNKVKKELIKYQRNDGVPLSGTLYYPMNYRPGRRYPTVIWAYPREYTDIKTAGQVRSATNRYARISGTSILFFVLRGYAVLDNAEIPVVGDPLTANDTFVEQITAGAQAAVDKLVELGIADRNKIGIAGHSYGAFMVANLLAHTELFAAGIARSGAYNRTLTPFGFQGERRTFWEAPEIYIKLSAFTHANKINEPLLMIHGSDDPNPGTFPIQSKRLFGAIKGHGGTARLVVLPFEGHGYEARESILHVLAEMFDWFDQHVRKRKIPAKDRIKTEDKH
jgi:dipeptidyl aminopeptidase/acylaminoacyl peptidase